MNGYVAAGYGLTVVTLAGYAMHVLRRARTLRARTPSSSRTAGSLGEARR